MLCCCFLWFLLFNEKDKNNQGSCVTSTFSGPHPRNSSSLNQNTRALAVGTGGREKGAGLWNHHQAARPVSLSLHPEPPTL